MKNLYLVYYFALGSIRNMFIAWKLLLSKGLYCSDTFDLLTRSTLHLFPPSFVPKMLTYMNHINSPPLALRLPAGAGNQDTTIRNWKEGEEQGYLLNCFFFAKSPFCLCSLLKVTASFQGAACQDPSFEFQNLSLSSFFQASRETALLPLILGQSLWFSSRDTFPYVLFNNLPQIILIYMCHLFPSGI